MTRRRVVVPQGSAQKPGQEARGSRVYKAVSFGSKETVEAYPSQQILQDPFQEVGVYGSVVPAPPFNMEQMVMLAETHPTHGAAIEQKVEDIISTGPKFVVPEEDNNESAGDNVLKEKIEQWWTSLFEDYTDVETLQAMWSDFETVGWGALEVVRDQKGIVRRLYHVPGHTLRSSYDGKKYLQIRDGKQVWFKKWGTPGDILSKSGKEATKGTDVDKIATELLVFKKPSRRSSWYGIPNYVTAIGNITLAVAARDYNILFFENAREPRHVFIISGLDEDIDEMIEDLAKSLSTQHKDPHRNLIIPISGDSKVDVQPLANVTNDAQFDKLMASADTAILIAHRMPPTRLGVPTPGSLSGPTNEVSNRVYKDGVVGRGQQVLEDRLNKFLNIEFPISQDQQPDPENPLEFQINFEELDITDEQIDTNIVVSQVANNLITLNEGRKKLGKTRHEPFADMTQSEYLSSLGMQNTGVQSPQQSAPIGAEVQATTKSRDDLAVQEKLLERMHNLDELVLELISSDKPLGV